VCRNEERKPTQDKPIACLEVRRFIPASAQHHELVLENQVLGDDASNSTGLGQPRDYRQ